MNALRFARVAVYGAVVALGFSFAPVCAQAATQAFMDISGAPAPQTGEMGSSKSGWIRLTSFAFGTARGQTPGASGVGAGKVNAGARSLNVTMVDTGDAEKLMMAATKGSLIPQVQIVMYNPVAKGLVPFYDLKLKGVMVTSESWSHSAMDKPSLTVSLVAEAEELSYNPGASKTNDPAHPVSWDLTTATNDLSTPKQP